MDRKWSLKAQPDPLFNPRDWHRKRVVLAWLTWVLQNFPRRLKALLVPAHCRPLPAAELWPQRRWRPSEQVDSFLFVNTDWVSLCQDCQDCQDVFKLLKLNGLKVSIGKPYAILWIWKGRQSRTSVLPTSVAQVKDSSCLMDFRTFLQFQCFFTGKGWDCVSLQGHNSRLKHLLVVRRAASPDVLWTSPAAMPTSPWTRTPWSETAAASEILSGRGGIVMLVMLDSSPFLIWLYKCFDWISLQFLPQIRGSAHDSWGLL